MKKTILSVLAIFLIIFLARNVINKKNKPGESNLKHLLTPVEENSSFLNKDGKLVRERFLLPTGFERVSYETDSFGEYLRDLPLKPHGSKVKYYHGGTKLRNVYEAVIDLDLGDRDLQQCADAVIRLRAEYLYSNGLCDRIHFNFTNGFKAEYTKWMEGNRIKVEGNKTYWIKQTDSSSSYSSFRKYLEMVFAYAGTMSLSQEMKSVPLAEMQIGDVFLKGGSPGHCVIVLDLGENKETGEKLFLLAQSYMPAQDIHILKNPANREGNPWYSLDFGEKLTTPEWEFNNKQLMRFTN